MQNAKCKMQNAKGKVQSAKCEMGLSLAGASISHLQVSFPVLPMQNAKF